ncbi:major facilitator transporter [Actinobacillus seminis]|uniref:Major facilitator transporter n=1 Tax=Actinobacillus seminis TaxID=722 RepID=A0A380VFD9_9PAST|nr:major facilitator transporter [Actinobacillus seminis]
MFVNGMKGGYGALIAEAYPTEARTTAQNLLFKLGCTVGGFGSIVVGTVFSAYSFSPAIVFLALIYVIDMIAIIFLLPENKMALGKVCREKEIAWITGRWKVFLDA